MRISQKILEHLLHTQHVEEGIKQEIEQDLYPQLKETVELYTAWLEDVKWTSHEARKSHIRDYDKYQVVLKILTKIALHCSEGLPLVSISSMITLTEELDSLESIQLSADLIAALQHTGLYRVNKHLSGTYIVESLIEPSEALTRRIKLGCYLPPLIDKPKKLYSNDDSGYHSINKDSLILKGKNNYHSGPISLDVLNKLNQNEYELDTFITNMEKPWEHEELTPQQFAQLKYADREAYLNAVITREKYLEQFNYLKELIADRTIYFTHKVDKRGRIYTQGYHFNTQGSSYEKASINLKKKELITGEL